MLRLGVLPNRSYFHSYLKGIRPLSLFWLLLRLILASIEAIATYIYKSFGCCTFSVISTVDIGLLSAHGDPWHILWTRGIKLMSGIFPAWSYCPQEQSRSFWKRHWSTNDLHSLRLISHQNNTLESLALKIDHEVGSLETESPLALKSNIAHETQALRLSIDHGPQALL